MVRVSCRKRTTETAASKPGRSRHQARQASEPTKIHQQQRKRSLIDLAQTGVSIQVYGLCVLKA